MDKNKQNIVYTISAIYLAEAFYYAYVSYNRILWQYGRMLYGFTPRALIIPVIICGLFMLFAYLNLTKYNKWYVQWPPILMSLLWIGGGILGFGWIIAIVIGVLYVFLGIMPKTTTTPKIP